MRVFVTGASGWIGSAVVPELLSAGHEVVGLARSDESAEKLAGVGAEVRRGDLDDLEALRAGAEDAEAVIHLAFKHDFTDFAAAGHTERSAIETLLGPLKGSDAPFLFASGVAFRGPRSVLTERDASTFVGADAPRGGAEALAMEYAERGVRPVALRFSPTVHGEGDHGFMAQLVRIAREKGAAGYVGDGASRWPAVHRSDAAHLVRMALETPTATPVVHAVAEEGVATRDIAEAIGRGLDVPVVSVAPDDAAAHFGWIGTFFALDVPASSALTRELLDWTPTGPTLVEDLEAGHYFRAATA